MRAAARQAPDDFYLCACRNCSSASSRSVISAISRSFVPLKFRSALGEASFEYDVHVVHGGLSFMLRCAVAQDLEEAGGWRRRHARNAFDRHLGIGWQTGCCLHLCKDEGSARDLSSRMWARIWRKDLLQWCSDSIKGGFLRGRRLPTAIKEPDWALLLVDALRGSVRAIGQHRGPADGPDRRPGDECYRGCRRAA